MPKDIPGVMHEWKTGQLHSGSKSGPKVTSQKQAVAIALSEQRQQGKKSGKPVSRRRADGGQFDGPPTPTGFGSLSHRPSTFKNPSTFAGRRAASRQRYV
jgi:hypothetical protein